MLINYKNNFYVYNLNSRNKYWNTLVNWFYGRYKIKLPNKNCKHLKRTQVVKNENTQLFNVTFTKTRNLSASLFDTGYLIHEHSPCHKNHQKHR